MSLEAALRAFLLADPAIAELVGDRVHAVLLPQGSAMPAVTFQRVSGQREHTTEGATSVARPRVQIDCWGSSHVQAHGLAEAVRARLDGYRGPAGDLTILGAFFSNEIDQYEDEPKLFRVSRDFFIWFKESSP